MCSQDYLDISKWACEIADKHNKSITYILMKIHEGFNQFSEVSQVKEYVTHEVERW